LVRLLDVHDDFRALVCRRNIGKLDHGLRLHSAVGPLKNVDRKTVVLYIECAFNTINATLIFEQKCV
jgi:hypothetical protein